MRKRANKSKGPRAASTRGSRGRGRSRGGFRGSNDRQREADCSSSPNKSTTSTNRRGASSAFLERKDNHHSTTFTSNSTNKVIESACSSSKGSHGGNGLALPSDGAKPIPRDFYLHKKFKKLTATLTSEIPEPSSTVLNGFSYHSSINNESSKEQGLKLSQDDSAIEASVISTSNGYAVSSASESNSSPTPGSSAGNMVYKPKFRIASESEGFSEQNGVRSSASSCLDERKGKKPSASGEPNRVGKGLRLDRQSLDDRISKIIDENQSLLEWPEHFTKKLKSHTTRNSQSHNHQRTNQLAIMSGGSTTELPPTTSTSTNRHNHSNGLVRHSSYDMNSSGGTVEFAPSSPLHFQSTPSEPLTTAYHQVIQSSPKDFSSISDLSFHVVSSAVSSALIVPKKRRRLSPTPSRLCGGEVSELPCNEGSSCKNYYQNVDMTVRVSNCSGAKVTIRTNNTSTGGSIQSGATFGGRFIESVPSLPHKSAANNLFFPTPSLPDLDDKSNQPVLINSTSSGKEVCVGRARNSRKRPLPSPNTTSELRSSETGVLKLETKQAISNTRERKLSARSFSVEKPKPSEDASLHKVSVTTCVTSTSTATASRPLQVVQSGSTNPKRPNFLALKPVNSVLKKKEVGVLPSPETPRVAKSYNQLSINGNAYTYLGFKVSTRSSYTCLFKPQPMFVPQHSDPKLSMYSTWQPCPKDPNEMDVSMSTNDSRVNGRKSPQVLYTSATGRNCDTLTVSSPDRQPPISSPMAEKNPLTVFALDYAAPVTSLSRSSEAVQPSPTLKSTIPSAVSNPAVVSVLPMSSSKSTSKRTVKGSMGKDLCFSGRASSSSDSSSADESSLGRVGYRKRSKVDFSGDAPLALTVRSKQDSISSLLRDDSNSASDSVKSEMAAIRSDGSRVKIMEGGFESNEDYTYIRGRGRGRYVCEACGIRCKKPSMLRKHLKTHTDLRPYTCKLCNFSFKTKGNLTKHQKSKSHHKKCISMGIHPESSQSLATLGPSISDSNSENDSDDDCDDEDNCGDSDSQGDDDAVSSVGNDNDDSVEKEIAQSLLDLSKMSRCASTVSDTDCDNSNKIRPSRNFGFSVNSLLVQQTGTPEIPSATLVHEVPIDLSIKPKNDSLSSTPDNKRLKNGLVRSIGVVGEAQIWEPEDQLMSDGCLNLKKVLNTGSPILHSKNGYEVPAVREIKQEVVECSVETKKILNGNTVPSKRSNSESSLSPRDKDFQNEPFDSNKVSELTHPSSSTSSASGPVKLHQPWLSPPERSTSKDSTELETVSTASDVKVLLAENENLPNNDPEYSVKLQPHVLSPERSAEIVNPISKPYFAGLSSLKPQAEFRQPSGPQALVKDEGKAECNVCGKSFARASQLTLHMNIHYLERPFRCDPCGVSFRTKGHLIKHRRSSSHDCKVYLTEAWGVANEENPRPFKCPDCKIAFRIHGHLAKHLRSKMHIMRMECLGKLPFGIYFEMEKSGMNLNEIDTTDCDMSLVSLQTLARKIYGDSWKERLTVPTEEPA